jgi:SSS family solute:Na+ symporter
VTILDWALILGLNGSIVLYGLYLARGTRSSADWFLAGRRLPWWIVGISMYATAIDSSDLVADSGGTYTLGFSYFVTNWVGTVGGWTLAAFVIFLPMYRAGMYTNAEYLEARFGVGARVISVFVQVQFRTMVLAIIARTLYLTLAIVCGWGASAWWAVVLIAVLASIYTAFGGLRSVAITDSLQFLIMAVTAIVFWSMIFNHVGGWSGVREKLAAADADLPGQMLHIGRDKVERENVAGLDTVVIQRKLLTGGRYDPEHDVIERRTPAGMVILSMIILGAAYAIVNHTQAMRMFAARSEWDFKMCAGLAGAMLVIFTFFNLSVGVMGRAIVPDQAILPNGEQDAIYPHLVKQLASVGLRGLLVAGVMAAALSTFDSIGSALSALLTRDVYARLIVRNADDRHYLRIGQWLTPVIIGGSFLYVPFLEGGMLLFYLDLTSAFVVPLLTLYLIGVLTPMHRRSGTIGLVVGGLYGIVRLVAPTVAEAYGVLILPAAMINPYAAYLYSMLITAGTTIVVSLIVGWQPRGELTHRETGEWLNRSREEAKHLHHDGHVSPRALWPVLGACVAVGAGLVLSFVVFW